MSEQVTYHLPRVISYPQFSLRDKPTPSTVVNGTIVIDLAQSPDSYRVKALCLNCKWEGEMRLPKGVLVTEKGNGVACPMCRCRTVTGADLVASETPDTDSSLEFERTVERVDRMYRQKLAWWEKRQERSGTVEFIEPPMRRSRPWPWRS